MSICVKQEPTLDLTLDPVPVAVDEPDSANLPPLSLPVPFCTLCIRECPANVESFEFNSENSTEFHDSLRELLGLEVQLQCFIICKTCWKMVWMIGDFREGCRKAQSWLERADAVGLAIVDDWNSEEMSQTIDFLQEAIVDHAKRVEQIDPAEDELVKPVFYERVEDQAYDAEETLLAAYPGDEHDITSADLVEQNFGQELSYKRAEAKKFLCKICNVSFTRRGNLKAHRQSLKHKQLVNGSGAIVKVSSSKKNVARGEKKLFRDMHGRFTSINRPDSETKPSTNGIFRCEKCDIVFTRRNYLKMHLKTLKHQQAAADAHQQITPAHKCSMCDARMASKTSLLVHYKQVHGDATFNCDQCDGKFKTKFTLQRHMLGQHANTEELTSTVCPLCAAQLGSKTTLKVHLKVVHGEAEFQCGFCDAKYKTKFSLKRHTLRHHTNTRKFKFQSSPDAH